MAAAVTLGSCFTHLQAGRRQRLRRRRHQSGGPRSAHAPRELPRASGRAPRRRRTGDGEGREGAQVERPPGPRGSPTRLLTHNHLCGVGPRGFPLRLQATEVRINPVEFNPDFVARMIPKVEWAALLEAADTLHLVEVPKEPIEGYDNDETFLRKMHHVLLEVDVLEGTLQCPESGRLFPISRGIPNMLLNDEETET
ncbi:multifunctional methyltransferase subunit TRM112-like protein [Sciurus carolinensis]|uniref:multifunctional methyltransferase subunit TRM112-like protein n=1 Tax=Sciurus carolinensis TaxID=30640 RepID=UPI001FB3A899|nr:multifunctional methyltransferase subunit TRM112-like protein [Sciurus carolinensis]